MREIKFRGKDINGIWIYGHYVALEDGASPVTSCIWQYGAQRATPVAIETVGQYTGLKDKNGVEIYEGDVYHLGDPNITYTVVWRDTGLIGKQNGASSYAGLSHFQDVIEVIGNTYENQNILIEEEEE